MKKYLLIIGLFTLFIFFAGCQVASLTTGALFPNDANITPQEITPALQEHSVEADQGMHTTESLIEVSDFSSLEVHYPQLDNPDINASLNEQVTAWINAFRTRNSNPISQSAQEHVYLTIDFSTYVLNETLMTILFDMTEKSTDMVEPIHTLIPLYYNTVTAERIQLQPFFSKDYLTQLSQFCDNYFKNDFDFVALTHSEHYNQGIAPIEANYSVLVLSNQGLDVIFKEGQLFPLEMGRQTVTIPPDVFIHFLDLKDAQPPAIPSESEDERDKNEGLVDTPPMIALTFDDGPHPDFTPQIAEILNTYGAKGTFFVQGNRVERYADVIRHLFEKGHEIANHSFNHPQLSSLSSEEIQRQIALTDTAIFNVTGSVPALLRPTYGAVSTVLMESSDKPLVLWSVDTRDWENRNSQTIEMEILNKVKDGDIVILHDVYGTTVDACKTVVPQLIDKGFKLVTVSELLEARALKYQGGQIIKSAPPQPTTPNE